MGRHCDGIPVYRASASGTEALLTTSGATTSFLDYSVTKGTIYQDWIKAVDPRSNSLATNKASANSL